MSNETNKDDDFNLIVPTSTGEREIVTQGPQSATIVWMVHIGKKENTRYPLIDKAGNKTPNITDNMIIFYELPDDLCTKGAYAGMPKMINHFVTLKTGVNKSGQTSALRGIIDAAEGKKHTDAEINGYFIFDLVGKHVQLNIFHKPSKKHDGVDAAITANGVNALHKSIKMPAPSVPLKKLYLPKFNNEVFKGLPDWVKKMISMDDVPVELRPPVEF